MEEVDLIEAEPYKGEGGEQPRPSGQGAPAGDRRHFVVLLVHGGDELRRRQPRVRRRRGRKKGGGGGGVGADRGCGLRVLCFFRFQING